MEDPTLRSSRGWSRQTGGAAAAQGGPEGAPTECSGHLWFPSLYSLAGEEWERRLLRISSLPSQYWFSQNADNIFSYKKDMICKNSKWRRKIKSGSSLSWYC